MVAGGIRPFLVIACVLSAALLVRRAIERFRFGAKSGFQRIFSHEHMPHSYG
jgi:hypothetical protein